MPGDHGGAEREPITGSGGGAPIGVQGQSPWSGGLCPHETESLSASGRPNKATNLPYSSWQMYLFK